MNDEAINKCINYTIVITWRKEDLEDRAEESGDCKESDIFFLFCFFNVLFENRDCICSIVLLSSFFVLLKRG